MEDFVALNRRGYRRGAAAWLALVVFAATGLYGIAQESGSAPRVRLNRAIEQLEAGKPAISGIDHMWIDMEHTPFDFEKIEVALRVLQTIRNEKKQMLLAPFVRIPMDGNGDPGWVVQQILEMDALGIVFPGIETKEQALRAVRWMRYTQPAGSKYATPPGLRGKYGAQNWGFKLPDYMRRADVWPLNPDGELFAYLQVETVTAIANIEDILSVPGIAGVHIGGTDLGIAYNGNAAEIEAATQKVLKACIAHKVVCGTSVTTEAEMNRRLGQGFRSIQTAHRGVPAQIRWKLQNAGSGTIAINP
jgi:4-hydroxy-2-oxoheptanedioate aldolase